MHALAVLHQKIRCACHRIHAVRLSTLIETAGALLRGRRLVLTSLGRSMASRAHVKHSIKRVDRLLGNPQLQRERASIYATLMALMLRGNVRPVIIVDWSDLATTGEEQLLRAALPMDGRAITLYEEVHPLKKLGSPHVQQRFLRRLQTLLPDAVRPIVVTDAGFRNSWFKAVSALSWDWVGRIRNRTYVQRADGVWQPGKALYARATAQPQFLGGGCLARSNPVPCYFYAVGRTHQNRRYRISSTHQRVKSAQREREPWLLASSLSNAVGMAQRVIGLYKSRMQIEEAFRDLKSIRYGFALRISKTQSIKRLQTLLLISALATFAALVIGKALEHQCQHMQLQANTTKHRRVLSLFYLGCQAILNPLLSLSRTQIRHAFALLFATPLHEQL